jgi:hypothetical protein
MQEASPLLQHDAAGHGPKLPGSALVAELRSQLRSTSD